MEHEVSGEDYKRNRERDKKDAVCEAIDAEVNDLILKTIRILDPKMLVVPRFLVRQEAIERIKQFLI